MRGLGLLDVHGLGLLDVLGLGLLDMRVRGGLGAQFSTMQQ